LNALKFVGAEIHVGANGANNAMVVDEGWSGAGPITSWVSHPSAIGYRLQGVDSAGSGSGGGGGGSGSGSGGGGTITIAAVSPDFDSGMNDGTDGQELERVANFYTGTEENPTSAQSAPTPRAEQDISNGVPPGNPNDVPTSTKGSSDGEDPPPSNLPPAQGPGTDPGDQPPPPTTVPGGPVPVGGSAGRPTPPQQTGPAFNPWNPWTYGPTFAQLGRDAVNVGADLLVTAKREAQLLPGTMGALPGAVGRTFQNGEAADSLAGAIDGGVNAVVNPLGIRPLSRGPIFGNEQAFQNDRVVVHVAVVAGGTAAFAYGRMGLGVAALPAAGGGGAVGLALVGGGEVAVATGAIRAGVAAVAGNATVAGTGLLMAADAAGNLGRGRNAPDTGNHSPSGRFTGPSLPNKTIVNENGVRVEHDTRGNDYPPAHAHVSGGGPSTRIGANGRQLQGDPPLSPQQKSVVENNLPTIRAGINKIKQWWRWKNHLSGQ
jgi:hypothetical protein